MKIHHIGYLTKDIQKSVRTFSKLGYIEETATIEDTNRKIKVVFMINGMYRIELIEPIDKSSSFYTLLKKYKNTAYHVCYQTTDVEKEIEKLRQEGYLLLQQPDIAIAIGNKKVAFLLHPNIGIIELLEIED